VSIRLLVIVGPTATGKTALGVEVAHALGSEIVSADSRQVYRGLDIGSGKDLEEYARFDPPVRYHLVDVADPHSAYSVFCYQQACYRLLEHKAREAPFTEGLPLVMVGGTGLYVEAVLRGYRIANVPEDPEFRERMMQCDDAELIERLGRVDPGLARRTDFSSKKRVVRALEIADHARRQPVEYGEPLAVKIEYTVFGVDLPREELHARIAVRLDARMRGGLIEEVDDLLKAGVPVERMDQLGLEYRAVTAYLTGRKTRERMVEDLRAGIRRLAKRQRTWFRGLPRRGIPLRWIGPEDREALLDHPFR